MRVNISALPEGVVFHEPIAFRPHLRIEQGAKHPLIPVWECEDPHEANPVLVHGDEMDVGINLVEPQLHPPAFVRLDQGLKGDVRAGAQKQRRTYLVKPRVHPG